MTRRLADVTYLKISKGKLDMFIKEKTYLYTRSHAPEYRTDKITEATFERNLNKGNQCIEIDYEDADAGTRASIKRLYRE